MPFANYKDFADCVAKNKDKSDPKAYCGSIQAQAEGKTADANIEKEEGGGHWITTDSGNHVFLGGGKESDKSRTTSSLMSELEQKLTTDKNRSTEIMIEINRRHKLNRSYDKAPHDGIIIKRVENPPLKKLYKDGNKRYHLAAYISSTRRDRDGDRFSKEVLQEWANKINLGKINLGQDHGHSWKDTMGVWKKAELRHNPHDGIDYLFADALLEDPDVNKDTGLLIHKSEIGEQISVSISANPGEAKWYDMEVIDGQNTRTIKSAELLKADVVSEPANIDARALEIVLKHASFDWGCSDDCIVCQFDECISSLDSQKVIKKQMVEVIQKDPDPGDGDYECKDCGKEFDTKAQYDDHMKSDAHKKGKDKGLTPHSPPNSSLVDRKLKLIEQIKTFYENQIKKDPDPGQVSQAVATTPAPNSPEGVQFGTDREQGTFDNMPGDLESYVDRVLNSIMTANTAEQLDRLQFNIPPAQYEAKPGVSGAGPKAPGPQPTPAARDLQTGIPFIQGIEGIGHTASPGTSGAGPQAPASQGVPGSPTLAAPSPMPVANVSVGTGGAGSKPSQTAGMVASAQEPTIQKTKNRSVLMTRDEVLEKQAKEVPLKQEAPGEPLPTTSTTKNKEVEKILADLLASQVKAQYQPADLIKMANEGKLLKELDPNGVFIKAVNTMDNKNGLVKRIGSVLLQKTA